jgi:putative Holliday junction resolvase
MRVLGIDYGASRVGVALGDTESRVASPWKVLENTETLVSDISALAAAEGAEKIIVGMPRPLQDQRRETEQAREIQAFIARLHEVGLPVEEENETWSSVTAARMAHELGDKEKRDDLAAAVILQQYLDRL